MKRLLIVFALNIVWGSCWVNSANAGVITMGTWTTMNSNAFWNNQSWDGAGLNVGELITTWGWSVEYLSGAGGGPAAFAFNQSESFAEITSITAWKDGRGLSQNADGSMNFTTHGYSYNSLTTPLQFSLFRFVGATQIVYFMGIEDIPWNMWNDHDYNDYIGYAVEQLPPPPPPKPIPTPEPGTLALMLSGGIAAWWRKRSRGV